MSGVLSTTAGRRRDGIPSQLIEMFRAVFVDNSTGFDYVVPAPLVLGESCGSRCQPTAAARGKPMASTSPKSCLRHLRPAALLPLLPFLRPRALNGRRSLLLTCVNWNSPIPIHGQSVACFDGLPGRHVQTYALT